MSSAGLGSTTTLLGGSPSGQAAGHVNNQTQFTLVLGGGGMKGVAHVGVLQALTERGLVPSQIVGSSVGALVGAAWSAGKSIAELHEIAVALVRKDIFAVAHADMAFKRMRSPARRNRRTVTPVALTPGCRGFWGPAGPAGGRWKAPWSPPGPWPGSPPPPRSAGGSTWTAPRWTTCRWARRASSARM